MIVRKTNREPTGSRSSLLRKWSYCTVNTTPVILVMLPDVAVISAVAPDNAVETTVARPPELIVATLLSLVAQVTDVVITLVDPSE